MNWQLETVSSVPTFLFNAGGANPVVPALDSFQIEFVFGNTVPLNQPDLRFLCDVILRILHRGVGALPSLLVERTIAAYGQDFNLKEKPQGAAGCIEWQWDNDLPASLNSFTDCLTPWSGDATTVSFDPDHPQNEARLFSQLMDHYGPRFAPCVHTQVLISDILPPAQGKNFQSQCVDFLIAFPNGRSLVLEPGDHNAGATPLAQKIKDQQRDAALGVCGIDTLRIDNCRIGTANLLPDVDKLIQRCDGHRYLNPSTGSQQELLRQSYLLLAPTLIARIEHALAFFLLQRGMLACDALSICIVEQDLECAELAFLSFFDRLRRLSALYGISCPTPQINLLISRTGRHHSIDLAPLQRELDTYNISVMEAQSSESRVDLVMDVAIKTNHLTPPVSVDAECNAIIRNTFVHSHPHRFSYSSVPREAHLGDDGEVLITSFLKDFFRKEKLRDGQMPIIHNILTQKATIGLLPTSAGKSICYQLSSLLTPGITFVVDPIVFLMKDQVLALSEQYGITKVAAWHAGAGIVQDGQIGELMATNIMIFMSPERFLRPSFRSAMTGLLAGDLYINYAVIDEAHCVSMWGHEFRPPYLMLERCFREYCTLRNHAPVVVALTGTASQLVLIDLKRELKIEEFEAIVRPNSFDREELTYNVVPCQNGQKLATLQALLNTTANRIGVGNVRTDAWGVLFAHLPKQVWDLYGNLNGDANQHIVQIANGPAPHDDIPCALACAGKPDNAPIKDDDWEKYKDRILPHFKRGHVRLLIGNAAIGVGIDNEYLNYVVTYCMPSSLESLGQQWGRAGRRGQPSQCCLIPSDDNPLVTDRWLNGEIPQMPKRVDDLGTVAYFHSQSFPGESQDVAGTWQLFGDLWKAEQDTDGRRSIDGGADERAQQYLSFLIMMGCAEDYTVTGMNQTTAYHVKLHPFVEQCFRANDENGFRNHLVQSLHSYLSRYRPITEQEIIAGMNTFQQPKSSSKAINYLIHFIYDRIAYQRKESIRTILTFCRETNLSPDAIRRRMKAFFDRSPKFSDRLDEMANENINIARVIEIVRLIEGYDDVEHLYWETRRLLDERFRADWAAINLYAAMYRELALSSSSRHLFNLLVDELRGQLAPDEQILFLTGFLDTLGILDNVTGKKVCRALLPDFITTLYERHGLEYLPILDGLTCDVELKVEIRGVIADHQMEVILHGVQHKHGLG